MLFDQRLLFHILYERLFKKEAPHFSIHQTTVVAHKEFFDAAILIRTVTNKFHTPSFKL